jgi:hypothetical protein
MFHKAPDIHSQHHPLKGENGLPEDYPVPTCSNSLLFYIQSNNNKNTVIYETNWRHDGSINDEYPMHVFWLRYDEKGQEKELNYMQHKLAYGYTSQRINNNCFEFSLVSYEKKKLFIDQQPCGNYGVYTCINDQNSLLTNVYAYADEQGVFPKVKYLEFYGYSVETQLPVYQKVEVG